MTPPRPTSPSTDASRPAKSVADRILRWRGWWWLAPLVLLAALTLPHLGDGDWMRGDSGWYAAIAVKAWRTGILWTLEEGSGRPYFNKPPLVFWIQGLWMWCSGVGAWQARLATVAAASACVAAVAAIAKSLAGRRAALVSGILLAANIEFFRRTREISLDMWNLAFMLIAAWALVRLLAMETGWRSQARPAHRLVWILIAGLGLAAALMTKPLVGLAVPVIASGWAALEFLRGRGRVDPRASAQPERFLGCVLAATLLGAGIAAVWHVSMVRLHGDAFTSAYFGREVVARGAGELVGGQRQTQPIWFYLVNAASAWTMWVIAAVLMLVRPSANRWRWPASPLLRAGLVWAIAWLVILTLFPDRRDRYALPMHAGLAMAVGALVAGRSRSAARVLRIAPVPIAVVALIAAVIPFRLQKPANEQWRLLDQWLAEHPAEPVWDGGFSGAPAARVYLMRGVWPRTTRDLAGRVVDEPTVGSVLLYHRRGGWAPGSSETVLWSAGDLTATRLNQPPWRPIESPDPGE